jgi:DNA polymerase-1
VFKTHDVSGRWSSGDSSSDGDELDTYNAQNEEAMFMSIFRAPPKMKYVGADFSGLELRVVAVQTGCQTLMDQFRRYDTGRDLKVHAQTARLIWKENAHLPLEEQKQHYESGKRYKIAKSGGFLIVYGGTEEALATRIITEEPYEPDVQKRLQREDDIRKECGALFRALRVSWKEIFENRERWYQEALLTGRLRTGWLTGRYIRFPMCDRDHVSPTLCANAPVQTTAGEIAHTALKKIHDALPSDCRIVLYIHDCIIVECPAEKAEWVRDLMQSSMEYFFEGPAGGLTCLAEPKIGDSVLEVK